MQRPASFRNNEESQAESALDCMMKALSILDDLGHSVAAAHLNLAVEVLQGDLGKAPVEDNPRD